MNPSAHDLLASVAEEIQSELVPLVDNVDRKGLYPEAYLRALGARRGFGAFLPESSGGLGLGLADAIDVIGEVGSACGSTAFLAWCQTVSAWYLEKTANGALRTRLLADVAQGRLLSGSGMSNAVKHLAGIERIHLKATRDGEGYRVSGVLPWVSNLGEDHLLIAAAEVAGEGYIMFAVHCNADGLSLHPCPEFSGMEGTRTLNPRFKDVRLDAADVLAHPHEFDTYMQRIKAGFILLQVGMGLGVARGSLGTIHAANGTHAHVNVYLDDQEDDLRAQLDALAARTRALADTLDATGDVALVDVLEVRAEASELALRAANSAALHAGARGYLMRSPAQRRIREAMFVAIVTPALKHLRKELARIAGAAAETA